MLAYVSLRAELDLETKTFHCTVKIQPIQIPHGTITSNYIVYTIVLIEKKKKIIA